MNTALLTIRAVKGSENGKTRIVTKYSLESQRVNERDSIGEFWIRGLAGCRIIRGGGG